MFAAGPSAAASNSAYNSSSFMGSLGQQVLIGSQQKSTMAAPMRAQPLYMMTTSATEGTTEKKTDENYMDKIMSDKGSDENKYVDELIKNAKFLVGPGKGILASDESNMTMGKRLEAVGVKNSEQARNDWRELIYTAPGIEKHVSGVIMYDETIRQSASDGRTLVKVCADRGILSGIKVDIGIFPIEGTDDETLTKGIEGLEERAKEYYEMGARFAKWRAVLKITPDGCPSDVCISQNAENLAKYAKICQQQGLVPIVEPEILTDGKHDIETCAKVSEKVLNAVVKELNNHKVLHEGMILKPNMITAGAQAEKAATPEEVAAQTVKVLGKCLPPAVPGVAFLSGGQSEEVACQNLNAMNKLTDNKNQFKLTYSFGRALLQSVLTFWAGKPENTAEAQKRLLERCAAASQASLGKYEGGQGSTKSEYVENYKY